MPSIVRKHRCSDGAIKPVGDELNGFSRGTLGNGLQQDIGVVKDASQTKVDACDQYNPAR